MKTTQTTDHAKQQAKAQLESIMEMVAALTAAQGEHHTVYEAAREAIENDPLSITVRSGWHAPGDKVEIEEFNILLCTGGPAVRIVGELSEYMEPSSVRLEYQDWGTPWTAYWLTEQEESAVREYASCFYFGE